MGRRADERPRGARQGRPGRERRGGDARRGRALREARRPKARAGSPGSGAALPRARRPWESRADRVRERLAPEASAGAACGRPRRPRDTPRRAAVTRSPSSRRGPGRPDRRTGLGLPGPSTRGRAWDRCGRWRAAPGPVATAGVRSPRVGRPRAAFSPESPPPAPACGGPRRSGSRPPAPRPELSRSEQGCWPPAAAAFAREPRTPSPGRRARGGGPPHASAQAS